MPQKESVENLCVCVCVLCDRKETKRRENADTKGPSETKSCSIYGGYVRAFQTTP